MSRLRNDDRGAALVIIAASLLSLVAFAGLVIDGGNVYSQRRQMQNAADASALAGANALQHYRQGTATQSVHAAALAAALANGANEASFECVLVNSADVEGPDCPETVGGRAPSGYPTKVRVRVDSDTDTRFIRAVPGGPTSFNARGEAAASLKVATIGAGPFMVCADPSSPGNDPPLLKQVPTAVDPTGWIINDDPPPNSPINSVYVIYDKTGTSGQDSWDNDCGLGTDFKGLVDLGSSRNPNIYELPGDWTSKSGGTTGRDFPNPLVGGSCETVAEDPTDVSPPCELALPLCASVVADQSAAKVLYCPKAGRFRIETNPLPSGEQITATFLGGGVIKTGAGGGDPGENDLVVIKLTE